MEILNNNNIEQSIKEAKLYLHDINILELTDSIQRFADSLKIKKAEYNIYRETRSILGDSLLRQSDEDGISSEDGDFENLLEYISDPDNNDTIKVDVISRKKEWQTTYLSDTLILHVKEMIKHINTDPIFMWLKEQQNDTLDLFITDINNDTVPLKLYENNRNLIAINISDLWGRDVSAIIKDITSNSFKLLIDNTSKIRIQAKDESKSILKSQHSIDKLMRNITMTTQEVPNLLSPWRFYGNASLDATQLFVHQWNKGGQSSLALLANMELYLKYKQGKHNLDSYAKFKLGLIRQGDYSNSKAYFETNSDIIDLQAKYGYQTFGNKIITTFLINFQTQFAPSYDHISDTSKVLVSKFFNPAKLTFAIGLNYKNKHSNFFFSPISAKTTIVSDNEIDGTKFGLEKGKTHRKELGTILKGQTRHNIWGDIVMENSLELFSNYIKNPQNIDISWDFKILFPINDYIKATLSTHFKYDDDEDVTKKRDDGSTYQSKGGQFKQMLLIGFYTFF